MSLYKSGIWKQNGTVNKNYIKKSGFEDRTNAGIYTFNGDVVTFESDTFGAASHSFGLGMDTAGLTDFKNQKLTFSMEYKIDTALEFGTTNPWVGFEMGVTRNTTTGGSSQWLDWYGGKSIPTAVTDGWVYYRTTVTVSNYDIASLNISFFLRDTKGKISYRHPKVEIGERATAWVRNEADVDYIDNNMGFVENDYKNLNAKVSKFDYTEARNFIEI